MWDLSPDRQFPNHHLFWDKRLNWDWVSVYTTNGYLESLSEKVISDEF